MHPGFSDNDGTAAGAGPRSFRAWVKAREHPAARGIYNAAKALRSLQVPPVNAIHGPLYLAQKLIRSAVGEALRIAWYTPLFQSRLVKHAPGLRVLGGIPLILGDLSIELGRNCSIPGAITLSGRSVGGPKPLLRAGNNVEFGWQGQISVGRRIEIGNDVFIAAQCYLSGYAGHPLDPAARAAHQPDTEDQACASAAARL